MKIKYDSSQVDRSKEAVTPPKPGTYKAKIVECNYEKESSQGERLVFVMRQQDADGEGNGKNYGYWDYVALDTAWKIDQYLQAIGVDTESKVKGTVDTADFVGKMVMIRAKAETYEGEYRAKLARVLPYIAEDEEGEDDEDFDEDVEVEGEEEEDEEVGADEEADEEDIIALGVDADEEDEDAAVRLEELCAEHDLDPNDFETWEACALALDKLVNPPKPAKKAAAKKSAAKKAAAKPKPEPEEEAADDDDYESWDLADLKEELTSRELKATGSKSALVARLRAHDEDPFA